MIFDEKCIKKIFGDAKDFLFCGFGSCNYEVVYAYIHNPSAGVNAYNYFNLDKSKFEKIAYEGQPALSYEMQSWSKGIGKAILTGMIVENFKRLKEGKSLLPVVFFVGLESQNEKENVVLDVEKIAASHSHDHEHTTDSELRRTYKIATTMGAEIEDVAKKTFKFIKIINTKEKFTLQELKPFWDDETFRNAWKTRVHKHDLFSDPNKIKWREELVKGVARFKK